MNREILRLALPNIISNISVPLISSVDTALMGQLSTTLLSALGVGGMIFMFLYGSLGFLRMGTTSLTAQAYGANNFEAISYTLYRAILVALITGFIIILLQNSIMAFVSLFVDRSSSFYPALEEYFFVRIYSAPAIMLFYVLIGLFFGLQNAKAPLLITVFINLVNLIVSIYLVKYLDLGILGVAVGTVVAQYLGLAFALFLFLREYRDIVIKPVWKKVVEKEKILLFFSINRDIFIRSLALVFSLAFFYVESAKYGEDTLGVMVLLLQFMIWLSFGIDGFANASESLVGKYYGAKDLKSLNLAVALSLKWGLFVAICFMLFYWLFGETILDIYSSDLELITKADRLMLLVLILPLLSFGAFIYDGIFIGVGAVKEMKKSVLFATFLYLISFFLLEEIVDIKFALWGSFVLFFLFRSAIQLYIWSKTIKPEILKELSSGYDLSREVSPKF